MKKFTYIFLILILIIAGVLFLKSRNRSTQVKTDATPGVESGVIVEALKIVPVDFNDSLSIMGTIKGQRDVNLSFETNGTIKEFLVEEGTFIKKGNIIANLYSDETELKYEYSKAKYNEALVNYKLVEKNSGNIEKLFKLDGVSATRVEEAKLELLKAETQLNVVQIDVNYAEKALDNVSIKAPFDGIFLKKSIGVGENITQNTLIGKFSSIDSVYAEIGVIERDLQKIKIGQDAVIYVDSHPGEKFEGKVEIIAPIISGSSRTMTLKIRILNEGPKLLPGMFARGTINLYSKKNAIVVPNECFKQIKNKDYVYKLLSKDKAVLTPVSMEYSNNSYSIISNGLNFGEFVILSGLNEFNDKEVNVKVKELSTLSK